MYTQEQVAAAKAFNALIDALPPPVPSLRLEIAVPAGQGIVDAMRACVAVGLETSADVDAACAQTDGPCSGEQ